MKMGIDWHMTMEWTPVHSKMKVMILREKVTVIGCGGAGKAIQIQAALDGEWNFYF